MMDKIMLDFERAGGIVAAIAQDAETGQVLMIAWMNREAFEETVRTRRAVYWSRSRQKLWRKGEESGNSSWSANCSSTATTTRCCSRSPGRRRRLP